MKKRKNENQNAEIENYINNSLASAKEYEEDLLNDQFKVSE